GLACRRGAGNPVLGRLVRCSPRRSRGDRRGAGKTWTIAWRGAAAVFSAFAAGDEYEREPYGAAGTCPRSATETLADRGEGCWRRPSVCTVAHQTHGRAEHGATGRRGVHAHYWR